MKTSEIKKYKFIFLKNYYITGETYVLQYFRATDTTTRRIGISENNSNIFLNYFFKLPTHKQSNAPLTNKSQGSKLLETLPSDIEQLRSAETSQPLTMHSENPEIIFFKKIGPRNLNFCKSHPSRTYARAVHRHDHMASGQWAPPSDSDFESN